MEEVKNRKGKKTSNKLSKLTQMMFLFPFQQFQIQMSNTFAMGSYTRFFSLLSFSFFFLPFRMCLFSVLHVAYECPNRYGNSYSSKIWCLIYTLPYPGSLHTNQPPPPTTTGTLHFDTLPYELYAVARAGESWWTIPRRAVFGSIAIVDIGAAAAMTTGRGLHQGKVSVHILRIESRNDVAIFFAFQWQWHPFCIYHGESKSFAEGEQRCVDTGA